MPQTSSCRANYFLAIIKKWHYLNGEGGGLKPNPPLLTTNLRIFKLCVHPAKESNPDYLLAYNLDPKEYV